MFLKICLIISLLLGSQKIIDLFTVDPNSAFSLIYCHSIMPNSFFWCNYVKENNQDLNLMYILIALRISTLKWNVTISI